MSAAEAAAKSKGSDKIPQFGFMAGTQCKSDATGLRSPARNCDNRIDPSGCFCLAWAIHHDSGLPIRAGGVVSAMSLLNAAFSALLGWLLFGERLNSIQWVGLWGVAGDSAENNRPKFRAGRVHCP